MTHKIFIGYNRTFESDPFSEDVFIEKIPLTLAISICSKIGTQLYTRQNDTKIQLEILWFLLRRQPQPVQIQLFSKIQSYLNKGGEIFLPLYINVFLKYCLENCKEFEYDDSDVENDLLILKGYIFQADVFNSLFKITSEPKNQNDFFRTNNWPIYLGQVHHTLELNPLTAFFKGILLLDFLKRNENLRNAYIEYLDHYKVLGHTQFLQILMKFILEAVKNKDQFFIKTDDFGVSFFSNFEFKIEEYRRVGNKDLYILENPIFKANNNSYYVLNYNYLANKLYHGVVFDFYKKTKISFKSFIDFKAFLGGSFIEKTLFKKIIDVIFKRRFYKTYFDLGKIQGFPDSLVIRKNKIFIFEVKDALLSNDTIQSKKYNKIKKEIDKFLVNDKGVAQIRSFLKKLGQGDQSLLIEHNLKISKIEIIPIIIYTDTSFNLPGMGDYLTEQLEISLGDSIKAFKKINPVLFINLDFLIDYVDLLQHGSMSVYSGDTGPLITEHTGPLFTGIIGPLSLCNKCQ